MPVGLTIVAVLVIVALGVILSSIKIVSEYDRLIVFRWGKYYKVLNPGFHLIIPIWEKTVGVDVRIRTIDVVPQEVITRDNVTIKVDAVVYFYIFDPKLAVCAAENYMLASSLIAQTTLRDVVGQYALDDVLSKRDVIAGKLTEIIDKETDPWGVKVTAVELKQVILPDKMQRVMAAEAEAEREKRAKLIHAQGELESSTKLIEAAKAMATEPSSMQLRFLQTLNEIAPEKTTIVIVPMPESIIKTVQKIGEHTNRD